MGPFNYQIVEVPLPKPGPNEVLMKMEATAICGSEYGLYYGSARATRCLSGHKRPSKQKK